MSIGYQDFLNAPVPTGDPQEAERQPIGGYLGPDPTIVVTPDQVPDARGMSPTEQVAAFRRQADDQRAALYEGEDRTAFYEGEELAILAGLTTEDLTRLQRQLHSLGLTRGVPLFGEPDESTAAGFRYILKISNAKREPWRQTLGRISTNYEAGAFDMEDETAPGYVQPARLEPDPARLRVDVRNFAEDRLGRDLDEDEVDYLTAALEDLEAENFETMVDADRAEFDARLAAQEGEDQQLPDSPEFGEAVVASRFSELFEERYAPEIDMRGRVQQGRVIADLVAGGAGMASRLTGGV